VRFNPNEDYDYDDDELMRSMAMRTMMLNGLGGMGLMIEQEPEYDPNEERGLRMIFHSEN
jgi:hypothetical protein